jgi:hypothetical protein
VTSAGFPTHFIKICEDKLLILPRHFVTSAGLLHDPIAFHSENAPKALFASALYFRSFRNKSKLSCSLTSNKKATLREALVRLFVTSAGLQFNLIPLSHVGSSVDS